MLTTGVIPLAWRTKLVKSFEPPQYELRGLDGLHVKAF